MFDLFRQSALPISRFCNPHQVEDIWKTNYIWNGLVQTLILSPTVSCSNTWAGIPIVLGILRNLEMVWAMLEDIVGSKIRLYCFMWRTWALRILAWGHLEWVPANIITDGSICVTMLEYIIQQTEGYCIVCVVFIHMCVQTNAPVSMHRGQQRVSGVLLYHSLPCSFEAGSLSCST